MGLVRKLVAEPVAKNTASAIHRLMNFGTEDLEIIEVQNGEYTGEDDIVRFDDLYER